MGCRTGNAVRVHGLNIPLKGLQFAIAAVAAMEIDGMKTLTIAVALLLASTAAAQAETFTFTGKGTTVAQVGGPGPMGKPVGASHAKNETEVTWASGKKTTSTGECMSWSAAPGTGSRPQQPDLSAHSHGSYDDQQKRDHQ